MSRPVASSIEVASCFPRVSGDEPPATQAFEAAPEFSPRERG